MEIGGWNFFDGRVFRGAGLAGAFISNRCVESSIFT